MIPGHEDYGEEIHSTRATVRQRVFNGNFKPATSGSMVPMKVIPGQQETGQTDINSPTVSDPPSYNEATDGTSL